MVVTALNPCSARGLHRFETTALPGAAAKQSYNSRFFATLISSFTGSWVAPAAINGISAAAATGTSASRVTNNVAFGSFRKVWWDRQHLPARVR
jgi:hypothetical protein